ncbi:MAG: divergent polysaccharide deacetylase family protein, partial [Thermoanaerobaculia bacterium]
EEKKGKEVVEKRNLKIAIVMDDLGQSDKFLQWFYENRFPLTLSFIPNLPHSREMAEKLHNIGYEIIIHLPMEPENYPEVNPGEGALLLSMKKDEIEEKIEEFSRQFPFARGLNNHMGSSFTSNLYKMEELMEILKTKGFFFLDSRTTPETKGYETARRAGVPFLERDVFLDNALERRVIKRQFEELLKKGKKKGYGIGICHPHPQTFDAIKEIFSGYSGKVDFVKLGQIFSSIK